MSNSQKGKQTLNEYLCEHLVGFEPVRKSTYVNELIKLLPCGYSALRDTFYMGLRIFTSVNQLLYEIRKITHPNFDFL
jgi:hypothetical protein